VDGQLRARVAILPIGPSLLVCDRFDAPDAVDLVAWPDDSSYHLASAIPPGRRRRWIDLGCGSAFAPLARPELADEILGIDINPRAIEHARIGIELSQIAHVEIARHDVAGLAGRRAELVTCNAPMPDAPGAAIWRTGDAAFFHRLWPAIEAAVEPGGLAVVHVATRAIPDDLRGERVVVTYTPEFAVLWWRPDAPARRVTGTRALTADRPHLDAWDRADAS
jgi:SAM-dependent methyltransferase